MSAVSVFALTLAFTQRRDKLTCVHITSACREGAVALHPVVQPRTNENVTSLAEPLPAVAASHTFPPLAIILVQIRPGEHAMAMAQTIHPFTTVRRFHRKVRVRSYTMRYIRHPCTGITVAIGEHGLAIAVTNDAKPCTCP